MAKAYEKYLQKDSVDTKQAAPKKEEKSYLKYIPDEMVNPEAIHDDIVKDTLLLGAQGASFGYLDEMAGAISPNYVEGRDAVRKKVEGARERLPIVGPVVEAGGSVATSLAIPPLRGGHWAKELGLAAIEGYGENTDPENVVSDIGFSVGTSGAANVVGGIAKKVFDPPEDILANAAGARGINYRKGEAFVGADSADEYADRLKDPAGLAARLDKIGFFGMGRKNFKNGQYVREGGLTDALEPVSLESMMSRVQAGVSHLGDQNQQILKGKKIPLVKLKAALDQAANDFLPAGEDFVKRSAMAKELSDNAIQDLVLSGKVKPGDVAVDAAAVEDLKRKWQKTVASSYDSGKAVSEITNVGVEARRKFSTALDKLVDSVDKTGQYAKNNDAMRDLLTVEKLIHDKASRQRGYSMGGPRLTNMSQLWHSLLENTVAHPQADLMRARIGQGMRTKTGQAATLGISRIPMEGVNSTIDQTPSTEGRMPQSIKNIPEELIRTPLPRTTDGLMKNKPFVLAKVAQMMPDMFEAVKDVYENNPESLPELAQVIAMKMPHVFEKDKYNRFDGRILSEQDKQKAIKDTLLNTKISTIEQARIITKLNKEGLYDL